MAIVRLRTDTLARVRLNLTEVALEFMALSPELEGATGVYYNNSLLLPGKHDFRLEDGSVESNDAAEAAELWSLSTQLTEAPEELKLKWPVEPQEAAAAIVAM